MADDKIERRQFLLGAGVVWDTANLKAYVLDPQAKVPGNRMPFSGLPPPEADDVVAYLGTLK